MNTLWNQKKEIFSKNLEDTFSNSFWWNYPNLKKLDQKLIFLFHWEILYLKPAFKTKLSQVSSRHLNLVIEDHSFPFFQRKNWIEHKKTKKNQPRKIKLEYDQIIKLSLIQNKNNHITWLLSSLRSFTLNKRCFCK